MSNPLITNAWYNSPFNTGQSVAVAPVGNPVFASVPLPNASAYSYYNADSLKRLAAENDDRRLYTIYTSKDTAYEWTNPDDGSKITVTPQYVAACSNEGKTLLYDRAEKSYILFDANRSLAVLPDNSIHAQEYGNIVTSTPDGTVTATAKDGMQQTFAADAFDPRRDLVNNGYLSLDEATDFAVARADGNLGQVPTVQRTFAPSSANALNTAQWVDSQSSS